MVEVGGRFWRRAFELFALDLLSSFPPHPPIPDPPTPPPPKTLTPELFFILTSVWLHQFYYLFGFLALVFAILALTCAEITIVLAYFQLCSEDYNW